MTGKALGIMGLRLLASAGAAAAESERKRASVLTPEVQRAAAIGIAACQDAKSFGRSVSQLQAQAFQPWRGGYRIKIDNPQIFAGDSSVSVQIDRRGDCRVRVVPMGYRDVALLRETTSRVLAGRPLTGDVVFVGVRDGFEVVLK